MENQKANFQPVKRSIAMLAQRALDSAGACNLSGIVHAFSEDISRLREIAREQGWESTEKLNTHPVSVLYSQVIVNLTKSDSALVFTKAYEACRDMARSTPEYDTPSPATR